LGRSDLGRVYCIIITAEGRDLNELLVENGLARIYGTRTVLYDGRDSRKYLARLAELEAKFPQFASADSPTQRVGDDRAQGFVEVAHRQRMLSLDNTYNEAEVRAFHTRLAKLLEVDDLRYTVEPKIDGLAVSLTYEDGKLVRAVTRGKGDRGDDVTANVRTIRTLPHTLVGVAPRVVEIRGEIYLSAAEFERINAERAAAGEELYANPRNLAAGTIKQLDAAEVARRKLAIVLYGLGYCEPEVVRHLGRPAVPPVCIVADIVMIEYT
jgi:DNA ligase (NAD+)